MSMNQNKIQLLRDYDRDMLKSAISSVFWAVLSKRKTEGYSLKSLADALGIHKSAVSRWFSEKLPNWEINTISDIAHALDLEVDITVKDRKTGEVYSPVGQVTPAENVAPVITRVPKNNYVTGTNVRATSKNSIDESEVTTPRNPRSLVAA
jgi:transcriptional regulator with XRE-family HTH domain